MDDLSTLSIVDMVAFGVIAIGGIQGFFRGLSGELARLAGTVIAFFAGTLLHEPAGQWISTNTRLEERPAQAMAFIATVLLAVVIMILMQMLLKKVITLVFAPGFDKTAGVLAGLLRMGLFVCLFFIAMNLLPVDTLNQLFGDSSIVGRFVIRYVPSVEEALQHQGLSIPGKEAPSDE